MSAKQEAYRYLYQGGAKSAAQEVAKQHKQSHVMQFAQTQEPVYQTEAASQFGRRADAASASPAKSKRLDQNASSLPFAGSTAKMAGDTTTAAAFQQKLPEPNRPAQHAHSVSLADFNPKFATFHEKPQSNYKSDFLRGEPISQSEREGGNVLRTEHRRNHFVLGEDKPVFESVSSTAYQPPQLMEQTAAKKEAAGSSILRQDDYNGIGLVPHSTTSKETQAFGIQTKEERVRSSVLHKHRGSSVQGPGEEFRSRVQAAFIDLRDSGRVNVLKAFQQFDTEMKGSIEESELRSMLTMYGIDDQDIAMKEIFKRCDKDGTGKIDYLAFLSYFGDVGQYSDAGDTFESISRRSFQSPQKVQRSLSMTSPRVPEPRPKLVTEAETRAAKGGSSIYLSAGQTSASFASQQSVAKADFATPSKSAYAEKAKPPAVVSSVMFPDPDHLGPVQSIQATDYLATKIEAQSVDRTRAMATSVVFSCATTVPVTSTTQESYVAPPREALDRASKIPTNAPHHNHLTSHDYEAVRSEASTSFLNPQAQLFMDSKAVENGDERRRRCTEARATHFPLGMRGIPMQSTASADFPAVDLTQSQLAKSIPGRTSLPFHHYSNVLPRVKDGVSSIDLPADEAELARQRIIAAHREHFKNPRDMLSNVAIRKAFALYDKKKLGFISREDLLGGLRAMGVDAQDSEVAVLLDRCGVGADGVINYKMFADLLFEQTRPENPPDAFRTTQNDFGRYATQSVSRARAAPSDAGRFFPVTHKPPMQSVAAASYTDPVALLAATMK
eukprot:m.157220 g.157220  ORF g.157220 m.157220 type:complete len:783 (+) comp52948_c0_seq1:55-2403(+)